MDLVGQRFGRLVVVAHGESLKYRPFWRCDCDCGATANVAQQHLREGSTRSCGCLSRELASERARRHGLSGTPEHAALLNAHKRCTNPDTPGYSDYGGRGIEYRLPEDYGEATALLLASIGPRPSGRSIDRIDNEGHYEIGNLRWATRIEQANNRRKRRWPTECPQGHPLVERQHRNGKRYRRCLVCDAAAMRRYRAAKRNWVAA